MNSINKLSLLAVAANAAPQFGPNFPFGNNNPFGPGFPFGNNNPGATTTTPAATPRPTCAFVIPGQTIEGVTFPPYVTIPAFTIADRTLTLPGVCPPTPGVPGVTTTTSITLPTTTTSIILPTTTTTTTTGGLPLPTDTIVAIGENGEIFSFNIQKDKAVAGDVISSVILEAGTILPDTDLPIDLPQKAKRQLNIGVAAVQECANLCAGNEDCDGFQTFVNDQDEQQCDLKNNLGAVSDLIGSFIGFKGNQIVPPTENLPTENLPTENLPTENLPTENLPTENLPLENLPLEDLSLGNIL
ncbi:hypothetical protein CBER1_05888 [Cercospora berteroae]|uniref:Uncharacterized protein n=1 Tax=Cercospora berteroae TaxID=357750 RepID=A0A2S6C7I8_9PEZI|nr:hypothetical protein CBER1_05888 [Cercospora berteroae]